MNAALTRGEPPEGTYTLPTTSVLLARGPRTRTSGTAIARRPAMCAIKLAFSAFSTWEPSSMDRPVSRSSFDVSGSGRNSRVLQAVTTPPCR